MWRITVGRRLIERRSAGFTPSTLKATDSEKNAMPNDMANRGCRTVPQIGWAISETQPEMWACARSHHEGRKDEAPKEEAPCEAGRFIRRRWVSPPVVDARILVTRLTGGSTSVRSFSQLRPAVTSANSGPHTEQIRAWAWKVSS